jgi:hypothetical protein
MSELTLLTLSDVSRNSAKRLARALYGSRDYLVFTVRGVAEGLEMCADFAHKAAPETGTVGQADIIAMVRDQASSLYLLTAVLGDKLHECVANVCSKLDPGWDESEPYQWIPSCLRCLCGWALRCAWDNHGCEIWKCVSPNCTEFNRIQRFNRGLT